MPEPDQDPEPQTLDLLIFYTAKAEEKAGGKEAIENEIILAVEDMNRILKNSDIAHRVRLADVRRTKYIESKDEDETWFVESLIY